MDKCYLCDKELGTFSVACEFTEFHPAPDGMTKDDVLCTKCASEHKKETNKNQSAWWYLLPIFFSALGGALMFIALRKENDEMAKRGLILGIVLQIIGIVVFVGLFLIGLMVT